MKVQWNGLVGAWMVLEWNDLTSNGWHRYRPLWCIRLRYEL